MIRFYNNFKDECTDIQDVELVYVEIISLTVIDDILTEAVVKVLGKEFEFIHEDSSVENEGTRYHQTIRCTDCDFLIYDIKVDEVDDRQLFEFKKDGFEGVIASIAYKLAEIIETSEDKEVN